MCLSDTDFPDTTKNTPLRVHCDAAHNHSMKFATAGIVVKDHAGWTVAADAQDLGNIEFTHQAEEKTIKRAINALKGEVDHIKVYTDAQNSVGRVKKKGILDTDAFDLLTLEWVPRQKNYEADLAATSQMKQKIMSGT